MDRRTFSKLLAAVVVTEACAQDAKSPESAPFHMRFGPHPGLLPGAPKDYIDELKFASDLGFRAWEDNGLGGRNPALQEKIGQFCKERDFLLGVMVITTGYGIPFQRATPEESERILADMRKAVEVAKRTGQTHMTVVPGSRLPDLALEDQIRGAADLLKRCCDIVEDSGIIMVLEPLSHDVAGKPVLLRSFVEGAKLCELVDRKSCRLLADFYHEGTIGNELIPNAEKTWSQVAYVQYGDTPGRKEPGTGELDLKAVTRWLHEKGYKGVIGMEHGTSAKGPEGLAKLIASYRGIDVG
jgi:hydroxypyruvate isomerase